MSRLFLRIFHRSDGQWTAVPLKCLYFFGEFEYSYCLDIATSIPDVTPYDNICLQCLPGLWVLELVSESDKLNIANDTYLSQTLNWMRFQGRNCHREPRRRVFSRLRIDASSSVTVHDQRSPYLPRSLGMSTLWCLQQGIVLARQDRGRWWRGKRNRQNSSTLSRQTLRTILVQCKEVCYGLAVIQLGNEKWRSAHIKLFHLSPSCSKPAEVGFPPCTQVTSSSSDYFLLPAHSLSLSYSKHSLPLQNFSWKRQSLKIMCKGIQKYKRWKETKAVCEMQQRFHFPLRTLRRPGCV